MNTPDSSTLGDVLSVPSPEPMLPPAGFLAGKENRLRRWFARTASRLFAPPYLPAPLVIFGGLLALATGVFSLMQQRPEFWTASANPAVQTALGFPRSAGPLVFIALCLGYALLVTLLLGLLTRSVAAAACFLFGLLHLSITAIGSYCGFRGVYEVQAIQACQSLYTPTLAAYGLFFGLALSGGLALLWPNETSENGDLPPRQMPRRLPGSMAVALALLLAWLVFVSAGAARNGMAPQPVWLKVQTAHVPSGRTSPALAYDTRRGQAVLFGGSLSWDPKGYWLGMNDTWVWDGQDWTHQHPEVSPPPRSDAALAFDQKRGVIVLFGGQNQAAGLDDTWEWDGARWTERTPAEQPPARCCARLAYDPERQKVVLFSGYAPDRTPPAMENVFYKDAWEWDGQTWNEITLDGSRHTSNFAFIQNPFQGGLLLVDSEGVWNWTSGWLRFASEGILPAGRYNAGLAYDPPHKAVILFGGADDKLADETWRFDGTTWERIYPARSPALAKTGYRSQNLFFDQSRGRVMMLLNYYDKTNNAFYAETWELALP